MNLQSIILRSLKETFSLNISIIYFYLRMTVNYVFLISLTNKPLKTFSKRVLCQSPTISPFSPKKVVQEEGLQLKIYFNDAYVHLGRKTSSLTRG